MHDEIGLNRKQMRFLADLHVVSENAFFSVCEGETGGEFAGFFLILHQIAGGAVDESMAVVRAGLRSGRSSK